jgi:hypothetical protein
MNMTWSSPPYAMFEAIASEIEARFGPPTERGLDSNGLGLFDFYSLPFACGLEIALKRFHLGRGLQPIDAARDPSIFEICANRPELEHALFHLGVPGDAVGRWTDHDGTPLSAPVPVSWTVMRQDDNGNRYELARVTSRCEAESLMRRYEARDHKQIYWVE